MPHRRRQAKRILLAAWLIFTGPSLVYARQAGVEEIVHIGTAAVSGVYYPAGGAICRLMNRTSAEHGVRCQAEASMGSLANLQALREGRVDFAVVQSNWQYQAMKGEGPFAGQPMRQLRAVFSLYSEPFTVLVRADSPFQTLSDLRHARINLGPEDDPIRDMTEDVFNILGWPLSDFETRETLSRTDQAKALCDGKVDVIFYSVGHPNGTVQQAVSQCEMRLIPITGETAQRLMAKAPYLLPAMIPGGMYAGNPEPTNTIGVKATLVTLASAPDRTVNTLVRAVFENLTNLKTLHPVLARLEPENMVRRGLSAPLHPAAEEYYRAQKLLGGE